MNMKILVVGGGGREHALADALSRSSNVEIYSVMGKENPGIAALSADVYICKETEIEQVAAYAGLTARVNQSGEHIYYGRITRQGSSWLRWALVQVALRACQKDRALNLFYTRIRKRSSAKIARVAVARKLAEICWKRLRRWHRTHPEVKAA